VGYADFCRFVQKGAVVTLAISGVKLTEPILVKLAHDVATLLVLNIFESELSYSYSFRNASLQNKGHFCKFCPKLVAVATFLEQLEKEVQIDYLQTDNYHLAKRW